jgi:hypothetical protein
LRSSGTTHEDNEYPDSCFHRFYGRTLGGGGCTCNRLRTSLWAAGKAARNTSSVNATAAASWKPDLWGEIRREIESAKAGAQASDAQLAGERLSIAASVGVILDISRDSLATVAFRRLTSETVSAGGNPLVRRAAEALGEQRE